MNATADAFFGIFGMTRVEQPMKLDVVVPIEVSRGLNAREHHMARAKRVKAEREATALALHSADDGGQFRDAAKPMTRKAMSQGWLPKDGPAAAGARVTLLRPYARTPLDSDNLSGAFKGVRDEVASFLGVDDKSERVHWRYCQTKAKRFNMDCGQPKCRSVSLKVSHGFCLKCKANGEDTHIRIRVEILPASDVDPMATAVRALAEIGKLYADECRLRGYQASADVIENDVRNATALATFDPQELYNVR